MDWIKFPEKPALPAPYDGKPFLGKVQGKTVTCLYKKNEYSDYWNFFYLDNEGDLQMPKEITEWKPML